MNKKSRIKFLLLERDRLDKRIRLLEDIVYELSSMIEQQRCWAMEHEHERALVKKNAL